LPKSSHLTHLAEFLLGSLGFILFAILEYAFVLLLSRITTCTDGICCKYPKTQKSKNPKINKCCSLRHFQRDTLIDGVAFILFHVAYISVCVWFENSLVP
jgi:hypothetical protein